MHFFHGEGLLKWDYSFFVCNARPLYVLCDIQWSNSLPFLKFWSLLFKAFSWPMFRKVYVILFYLCSLFFIYCGGIFFVLVIKLFFEVSGCHLFLVEKSKKLLMSFWKQLSFFTLVCFSRECWLHIDYKSVTSTNKTHEIWACAKRSHHIF